MCSHSFAQGMSNAEIAVRMGIGEGTVKSHVNHLLAKLQVATETQAVLVAHRRGFVSLH